MDWIHEYQLFLFDMDGLLVNTEEFHYHAYQKMCRDRGFELDWDFGRYCMAAHYDAEGLRDQIYAKFPELHQQEPDWSVLYAEKKKALMELFHSDDIHMMPGAEELLKELDKAGIKRAVVTHSASELVELIRKKNPVLDTISTWITRFDYSNPKPHPECYRKAIAKLGEEGDQVIGFEDTPRGLKALMETEAQPVMISKVAYPEIDEFKKRGVLHYPSFNAIPDTATFH